MKKSLLPVILIILFLGVVTGCVKDRNYDIPEKNFASNLSANSSYSEVKALFQEETVQIQEDIVIEGYVTSSDASGNFFSVLHFQDHPTVPTEGFQIEIDLRDSHLFYPLGSKIYIKLKGLYLGKSKQVYKIGGVFTSFGSISVGRLPATVVGNHVVLASDETVIIVPYVVSIEDIKKSDVNTIVQFEAVQIIEEDLGKSFAVQGKETERVISDCKGNEIVLINSGFSDFYDAMLPTKNGRITGVLMRENDTYQLVLRTLNDIEFYKERCDNSRVELSSNTLFISEIADPDNNSEARFIELYNEGEESLSLNGWRLLRYTNANTEVNSEIDLSGLVVAAKSTFVISNNAVEFERVYGFAANMAVGKNSPADSNGDDNLVLVDPFGKVIDIFGFVGEDGSGTNHEFEDGRALRNIKIKEANPIYTIEEWRIFNDSGNLNTRNQPQNAPQDFTPGIRN